MNLNFKKNNIPINWIITSVINFAESELSYSKVRSIYTPEQRITQTLKTIESIRTFAPESKIILFEMGVNEFFNPILKENVDQYFFLGKNIFVKYSCKSKFKGLGEAIGLLIGLRKVKALGFIFKISGRYYLNENFDLSNWDIDEINLKQYDEAMSTRLYGFPIRKMNLIKNALFKSLPNLFKGKSIEESFFSKLNENKIVSIKELGISGFVAPDGQFLTE